MNEHAHVAQRSWAPVIIGTGLFFINAGFVFGLAVGLLGLVIMAAGVVTWIREDVRIYAEGSDEHGEPH
jgi:hypothetical protein